MILLRPKVYEQASCHEGGATGIPGDSTGDVGGREWVEKKRYLYLDQKGISKRSDFCHLINMKKEKNREARVKVKVCLCS